MEKLTNEQGLQIVQVYHQNSCSVKNLYHLWLLFSFDKANNNRILVDYDDFEIWTRIHVVIFSDTFKNNVCEFICGHF